MMRARALALVVVCVLGTGAAPRGLSAQAVQTAPTPPSAALTVEISPPKIRVGDVVEATLTLDVPTEVEGEPLFPNWQRHWGSAEIREIDNVVTSRYGAGSRYVQKLRLTAFRPGVIDLPAPTVSLASASGADHSAPGSSISASDPPSFEVVSVLPPPGEEELEPKPPEAPRTLATGAKFWWAAGLLTALLIGLLVAMRMRTRAGESPEGTQLDPWTALERALAKLAATTDPEAVFTGLSLELRRFLGRCLAFPAAESTTTELRRRLRRSGLPDAAAGEVVRLLLEADTIKFARQTPKEERLARCLDETRAAAGQVRTFLQPPAEEPATEHAA